MTAIPDRCGNSWIQTYTGRQFWPLNARVEDIDILDIAHALSMKCRFSGHSKSLYTVAQHSVLASFYTATTGHELWALLHDATEAYLPDVAKPIKGLLNGFCEIEDRLMDVIATKYGLPLEMPTIVKEVDRRMLATEQRDLMGTSSVPCPLTVGVEPYQGRIQPWSPEDAKFEFLVRFNELTKLT